MAARSLDQLRHRSRTRLAERDLPRRGGPPVFDALRRARARRRVQEAAVSALAVFGGLALAVAAASAFGLL